MRTIIRQLSVLGTRDLRHLHDAIFSEIQRRQQAEKVGLKVVEAPIVLEQARNEIRLSPLQARVASVARSTQLRRAA